MSDVTSVEEVRVSSHWVPQKLVAQGRAVGIPPRESGTLSYANIIVNPDSPTWPVNLLLRPAANTPRRTERTATQEVSAGGVDVDELFGAEPPFEPVG